MAYSDDVRAEARRCIIWDGLTAQQTAERMGGAPASSTIDGWARTPDRTLDGRTWYQERDRLAAERYQVTQPEETAHAIIKKIHEVIAAPGFDEGRADQLSKLSKHLRTFVDPKFHLSMTYQVLRRLLSHLSDHHPDLLTRDLAHAVRAFKAHERDRLERR